MRLLWLTDDYLPHRGGSRIVYHNVCANISDAPLCLVTRRIDGAEEFDRRANYCIKRIRVPLLGVASALDAEELALLLPFLIAGIGRCIKESPDVIHCGEPLVSGLVGYIIRKLFGIPYIIWLHDNPFGPVSRIRYPLKKFLCMHADGIITCCNYARESILREGYAQERLALVNPGVDTSVFTPSGSGQEVRRRFGLCGKKVLLTISRLLPHKGQDMVIRALPELLALHPDLVYLVVGAGPYHQALEELARSLGVSDAVFFAGFIPQDELSDYYNACDLFIMLNRKVDGLSWEGFGIVFIEASACGKPVIGGRAGGVTDSILEGKTGLLVDPEKISEIVECVDLLLRDEGGAHRMGQHGMERARSGFSWKDRADKTLAFSERIATRRSGNTEKIR